MRLDEMIARMDEIKDRQLGLFRRLDDPSVEAELSELDAEAAALKDLIDAGAQAAGAEVDQADQDGWTALMRAARTGPAETVQALLAAGAEVDQADHGGWTALMWAAFNGQPETVQALLAAGADPHHADHDGETALMWAARRGYLETVQTLLAAGATLSEAQQARVIEKAVQLGAEPIACLDRIAAHQQAQALAALEAATEAVPRPVRQPRL